MVTTGNGKQGLIPEREPEMATTSKEGSRRTNYPLSTQEVVTKNNNTGLFRGPVTGMSQAAVKEKLQMATLKCWSTTLTQSDWYSW